MKIVELVIDENEEGYGVDAVSVVHSPAIEVDFVALSKEKVQLKTVDEEKQILLGPALIPNKQIYREDEKNGQYYIYFSKDTVRKASELFMKNHNQEKATYEHMREIDNMVVVESWIVTNPEMDKSKLYGFEVPEGTWFLSMKVNNDEVWKDVKEGKVKGFSIEGYFSDKLDLSKRELTTEEKIKKLIVEWANSNQ